MSDGLSLEKLKIVDRLLAIENHLKEDRNFQPRLQNTLDNINLRTKNLELMVHGDNDSKDKYTRDGMNRRLEGVEAIVHGGNKTVLKVAVGSITLAVGSAMVWLFTLIWSSLGKR